MKTFLTIFFCFLVFTGCEKTKESGEKKESNTTPKVSILGVFHFAGTSDFSSVEFESLESEKRQQEIKEIVEKLKEFRPTKVMLEFPSSDSQYLDSLYTETLNGNHDYTINEIEQLGFRLAKELNHNKVYSIDYRLDLPFEKLIEFAEKNDKERFENMVASIKKQDKKESDFLERNSILDYLIYRNSDEEDIRNKDQYLNKSAKFVNDSSYIGAKFVSKWWERNIYMMTNIDKWITQNDRILVIVGAAHRAVLKDFYEDRTDVEYVEITNFLKKKK
ncbi:DUF5694 domain-containing protein [Flagellimonas sp. CMM7]|uniref:DUF5694 domain-containing protein n=1 Tax=Flagellimonas sp. CMM7 TaxID=2654676 RepID=UPI0013CF56ED|nr:DUF5694 domain-containing protein [Flagellimonas sp. CMM7]UII81712.1 DUF5694 domain-containing protein [Flagellimonas sp. CMM7]